MSACPAWTPGRWEDASVRPLPLSVALDAVNRPLCRRLGPRNMTSSPKSDHHFSHGSASVVCKGPHSRSLQSQGPCCNHWTLPLEQKSSRRQQANECVCSNQTSLINRQVLAHKHNFLTGFSVSFCEMLLML